jgi:predicted  nucleic acid-binding Zn-ribbon protein
MQQQLNEIANQLDPVDDDNAVESGLRTLANLRKRNVDLERGANDAVLAIKARDLEIENLRLQIAERDNRIATIQASADERVGEYQCERDLLVNEAAELRAIFANVKHLIERTVLPLPRIAPPEKRDEKP